MSSSLKFPSTVEIKRVLAAAQRAGVEIGSVEIEPRKITIHPKVPTRKTLQEEYAEWKKLNPQHPYEEGRTSLKLEARLPE